MYISLSKRIRTGLFLTCGLRFIGNCSIRKALPLKTPSDLMKSTDAFIFDCDGVIWKGNSLIPRAADVLTKLRSLGKSIFFVTNNSTKSRKGFLKKFTDLGLYVKPEEILSSSFAAALYFKKYPIPQGKKVYIIGQDGIGEELDLIGIPHLGGPKDSDQIIKFKENLFINHDRDVAAVVVGFDSSINYYKIQYAQLCINQNPGCKFIATNLDAVGHFTDTQEWAGGGSMVGAVKGCTGKEPIVVGKPSPLIIDYIVDEYKVDKSRICMIGDRLDTDVLFGLNNGLETVLTLSGVTDKELLLSDNNNIQPTFYINSIADLI